MAPLGFSGGSAGKESACNAGDLGSIPGLGRSPGEGKGYPLQYSGLENSMGLQRDTTERLSLSLCSPGLWQNQPASFLSLRPEWLWTVRTASLCSVASLHTAVNLLPSCCTRFTKDLLSQLLLCLTPVSILGHFNTHQGLLVP